MANFDGVHIRRTALRLGMRTDAAMRFEKSINPLFSLQMIHRLLDELKYHRLDLGETNIQ
jgi:phenylalanyl-tRNA synthetase beta subunit